MFSARWENAARSAALATWPDDVTRWLDSSQEFGGAAARATSVGADPLLLTKPKSVAPSTLAVRCRGGSSR